MSSSKRPVSRPTSPFMLGPYYKFQITSVLSLLNRLTGVYTAVVTAPLLLAWLMSLVHGEQSFVSYNSWLASGFGKLVLAVSVFCFSFHLLGGIRHLIWDAGWMMEMPQVRISGWLAVVGSVVLTLVVLGAGS